VITVSDRASRGEYADRSGPAVVQILQEAFPDAHLETALVPDDLPFIEKELRLRSDFDWILTTGGSGISPRDLTPEATRLVCEREIPGIADWLRTASLQETPHAVFSRGCCGQRGRTIIVNLPGSEKGARFCTRLLAGIMVHGTAMIRGEGH